MKKFITNNIRINVVWYIVWLIAGIFILFWRLGDLIGLHSDEAVFGIYSEMILEGARPLWGIFNIYTAPIHAYMLAIVIKIFGNSIWSLRILGPIFTLITIAMVYDIIRHYSVVRARWIACFLITFPPVVIFSRLCAEVYVLNPLLFFGTIWIYQRLCLSQKKYIWIIGWVLASILVSVGIWNHVIFLPSALALVFSYLVFLWPGLRLFFIRCIFFTLGFLIGLIPRIISAICFDFSFFPERPSLPLTPIVSTVVNLFYTLSGDGLCARFSGGSKLFFAWGIAVILLIFIVFRYFSNDKTIARKLLHGISVFFICNFLFAWKMTEYGSINSRFWLIPVWVFPILLGLLMVNIDALKGYIIGSILISINIILLLINYYIPNSNSPGALLPVVDVGGTYDNSWDYFDHREIVKRLSQVEGEYIFISDRNVFTFYYLMPKDQRHRIKMIWPIKLTEQNLPPGKIRLFNLVTYLGPIPKSSLFVFYDSDKVGLDHFSRMSFFKWMIVDKNTSIPGFLVYRVK